MTDLLLAVDALTQPVTDHVAVIGDDGKWLRAHSVTHAPLLELMHEAVNPSGQNTSSGSGALPGTRAPADLYALYEWVKMTSEIRSWCRILGAPVTLSPKDPVEDLRAFYWWADVVHWGKINTAYYVERLNRWVNVIENTLRPGESFEAHIICPICRQTSWGDPDGINPGGVWTIQVSYRLDDNDNMTDLRAVCRGKGCNTVWSGRESIEELADEVNERQAS